MSSPAPPVPDRIGRYKIERKIGGSSRWRDVAARWRWGGRRLDRDISLQACVAGTKHLPHTTAAKFRLDDVRNAPAARLEPLHRLVEIRE